MDYYHRSISSWHAQEMCASVCVCMITMNGSCVPLFSVRHIFVGVFVCAALGDETIERSYALALWFSILFSWAALALFSHCTQAHTRRHTRRYILSTNDTERDSAVHIAIYCSEWEFRREFRVNQLTITKLASFVFFLLFLGCCAKQCKSVF